MHANENIKNVIVAVAAAVISVVLYHLAGRLISGIVSDDFLKAFLAEAVFAVLTVCAVLVFRQKEIFRSDRALFKSGWKSAGVFFAIIILFGIVGLGKLMDATATGIQFLLFAAQMILIGFCEEVFFRGFIQRAFHRLFGEDSFAHVFLAILCSGVIFGVMHIVNMDRGNPLTAPVMQAAVNCFSGIYLGAIYFRTGKNIRYMILLHALYDFVSMIVAGRLNGVAMNDALNPAGGALTGNRIAAIILIWGIIYLSATFLILRKKKITPLLSGNDSKL